MDRIDADEERDCLIRNLNFLLSPNVEPIYGWKMDVRFIHESQGLWWGGDRFLVCYSANHAE